MKSLSGVNVDACVHFIISKIAGFVAKKKDARSCLCCGIQQSVTWRPSDFGRNTLCNRCGLKWLKEGEDVRRCAHEGAACGVGREEVWPLERPPRGRCNPEARQRLDNAAEKT